MEMAVTNRGMQPMSDFGIQFNKNSFGLAPAGPLSLPAVAPGATVSTQLVLTTAGAVQKMEPLNTLQVAIKNNLKVFYFATAIPLEVLFAHDGKMDRQVFLATWKDIPAQNESSATISGVGDLGGDKITAKLESANVFNVAKRNVEGVDMLYNSFKLSNGIWCLLELRIQPGSSDVVLSLKARQTEIFKFAQKAIEAIFKS